MSWRFEVYSLLRGRSGWTTRTLGTRRKRNAPLPIYRPVGEPFPARRSLVPAGGPVWCGTSEPLARREPSLCALVARAEKARPKLVWRVEPLVSSFLPLMLSIDGSDSFLRVSLLSMAARSTVRSERGPAPLVGAERFGRRVDICDGRNTVPFLTCCGYHRDWLVVAVHVARGRCRKGTGCFQGETLLAC